MKLDKEDIKQIRGVVKEEITVAKKEIIATLTREINDLAEINRVVISEVSKIAELEKRIIRIEHKIGIAG